MSQISRAEALRYNRQIVLPQFDLEGQEALLASKVLIIGLGGLGCASSQYLAAAGVGALTLIDDDTVELSNLQRQVLHNEERIGQPKVTSAVQALREINPQLRLTPFARRFDEQELSALIGQHDLVLDCSDNLLTREQVNRACFANGVPLVSGAAIRMEGQVCSFIPLQGGPCYACISALFAEQTLSCTEAGVMSPVVGVIGSMQALEAIKILASLGTPLQGKLLLFDAMHSQWQSLAVTKRDDCPVCAHI